MGRRPREHVEEALAHLEFRGACGEGRPTDGLPGLRAIAAAADWPDLAARLDVLAAEAANERGELAEAAEVLRDVLDRARSLGDAHLQCSAHLALARVFRAIGDMPEVLAQATSGLAALGCDPPWWQHARGLYLMGIALDHSGSWHEAKPRFQEAVALASESPQFTLILLNNLAYGCYLHGELDEAERHGQRMLDLVRNQHVTLSPIARETLARIAMLRGDYALAERHLAPVVETSERPPGGPDGLAWCVLTMAEIRRLQGRYDEAAAALDRCIDEAETCGLPPVRVDVTLARAELQADQGHYREAYLTHREYHAAATQLREARAAVRAHVVHTLYANHEAATARDQYRELAIRDPLTGLYNRRYFDGALAELTIQAPPQGFAVAIIDLDHFKQINDTRSHATGDQVLRSVAAILVEACPPDAVIARIGGEEFALVLPRGDPALAVADCERVRQAIRGFDWAPVTGVLPVTVSIGVTMSTTRAAPTDLLSEADRRLYAAKRRGRDRVVADAGTARPSGDPL